MTVTANGVPPVVAPLAPLQSSMLAASLAGDTSEMYVTQAVFELSQDVDHERWSAVWQQLAERHETLRTIFVTDRQGEAVQVFLDAVKLPVRQGRAESAGALEVLLENERRVPFVFDRAPLLRLWLIKGTDANDLHVLTFHHALLDGWSVELLMAEALVLYAERTLDPAPPFRRYLGWYRGQQSAAAGYWKDVLRKCPEPASLPGDTADDGDGVQRDVVEHQVDPERVARLKQIGEQHGLTANAMLGALWYALVARVTGQADLTVGMVSAGRDAPVAQIQRIPGLVMNAIPVRVVVNSEQSIVSLAQSVQHAVSGGAANGHLPLRDMLRSAGVVAADAPYHTMLVFEQVAETGGSGDTLHVVSRRYVDRSSLPLSVLVFPGERSLTFRFQFNASRFTGELVASLATAFMCGLEELCAAPEACVGELAFGAAPLTPSDAKSQSPRVVEQIASNLVERGESIALSVGERQRSWAELHDDVGRVVAALGAQDMPPDSPVLIRLPSSAEAVAVLLGALFCGRPYIYLDPAYPAEHHERVIAVVREEFGDHLTLITDEAKSGELDVADVFRQNVVTLPPCPPPDALAYIVFTSGSTGTPKGVKVSQANLDYSNASRAGVYATAPQRFLLLSSLAFDSSVVGLFWTLANGGELVLPGASLGESLDRTAELVRMHQITHTLCLPSVYRVMLNAAGASDLDSLACVIVAGEACHRSIPTLHARKGVGAALYNEYGPSEATVWCSSARLEPSDTADIEVGHAPEGTTVYVRSAAGEPLCDGLPGELVVAGPGVACGYLGADASSAFFHGPAGRSYATGDLALIRDGEVTLLGRRDGQLKINGVRIELADVERHVSALSDVDAVAVVDFSATDGRTRLAAHVVAAPGSEVDPVALRDTLKARVPAALVPARFVAHAQLPRLANGKLDRNALVQASADTTSPATQPSGDVNAPATIRALMQNVTGIAPSSDTQSFFDLGGDSLAAVNLVDRINAHFGVSVNVADVYQSPTSEALGRVVNANAGRDDWLAITPINPNGTTAPLYFAYGNAAILGQHLGSDVPLYWVVHGRHGIVYPTDSFQALADAHYKQLRRQQPSGPYCLAGFSVGAIVITEVARRLRDAGEQVPMLVLIDPTSPRGHVRGGGVWRALALLRSSVPLSAKLRFFAGRLRDRLRGGRATESTDAQSLAGLTLHTNAEMSRDALIQAVATRLESHPFAVCPGDATLMLPDTKGVAAAHNENDRLIWHELFAGNVEDVPVSARARHTELFADETAMRAVAAHLRTALDRVGE